MVFGFNLVSVLEMVYDHRCLYWTFLFVEANVVLRNVREVFGMFVVTGYLEAASNHTVRIL